MLPSRFRNLADMVVAEAALRLHPSQPARWEPLLRRKRGTPTPGYSPSPPLRGMVIQTKQVWNVTTVYLPSLGGNYVPHG